MPIIQTEAFAKRQSRLNDKKPRAIIAAIIFRLANDLPVDKVSLGDGVEELRVHYGPGYRIYFQRTEREDILLLCEGNKTGQKRDIIKAKQIAAELLGEGE